MEVQIEFMWKDTASNTGNCPALYRVKDEYDDGYVVQGKRLGPKTRAMLQELGGDEDAVFVPANVIDRIKSAG